ncbi:phosphopentomutase [Vreelandella subglaciescola]|jgi:phosphopentomutase|uniref:Phosphopentomutase n=1 Tax=Vreelandella subglaciescola TaxID=29571 RepID=A0A1M7I9R8_9GAMM|nr:phosphopentomutase [Halomonas subglaciescola]SHM37494.1 phosphopentomutase [Halomonas subglaciescola]
MTRAIVLVLDSFGIGSAPDADAFGDTGADTLGHIAEACAAGNADTAKRSGPLTLPNMARLGLFHAHRNSTGSVAAGVTLPETLNGAHAHAQEISSGKDTPSGHWEIAGVPVRFDWGYFTPKAESFPPALLEAIIRDAGLPGVLGNCHASGTEIIARLGDEHVASGKPIVYTSADSVFQIAAHETHFGLERLYALCETVRELLAPYNIGRVIARPFAGDSADDFARTGNRRDYSIEPPAPTVLQKLADAGGEVVSIGKIADIYAHCGITHKRKANGHDALMDATLEEVARTAASHQATPTLIMTNFVDFDSVYGHRRDIAGYAAALEHFDARLPELVAALGDDDLLLLTADHGCDPSWHGTEHTREYVPVLVRGAGVAPVNLGERATFADIGQSLAGFFELAAFDDGESFLPRASR